MENFNNNGLFISEPIFEEDFYYDPNTMKKIIIIIIMIMITIM